MSIAGTNLSNRLHELLKNDSYESMMELDCLEHLFACEGLRKYQTIATFCKENGFKKVYDIGCAYGHQNEVFLEKEIAYVGINEQPLDAWNQENVEYIFNRYPFSIQSKSNDIAVSVLCLTWNCYLYKGEETLRDQLLTLSTDFDQCILYVADDKVKTIKEYYPNVKELGRKLYYFYK